MTEQQPPSGAPSAAASADRTGSTGSTAGAAGAQSPEEPAGAAQHPPRLTRSRRHKVVSGVCGGLGRHFDLDPLIFRVALGVISVTGGIGLIAYGFAWLLIPFEDEDENELRRLLSGRVEGASLTALLSALVGCGLFLSSLGREGTQAFSLMLAGSVVGAAYWSQHRRRAAAEGSGVDPATAQAVAVAPPEAKPPPARHVGSWWQTPPPGPPSGAPPVPPPGASLSKDDGEWGTDYLWGPDDAPLPGDATGAGTSTGRRWEHGQRRPGFGALVLLGALAAAAFGTGVSWATQPVGTSLVLGLGCALAVFGLGLVVGAFTGRLGLGTVVAVMLTGALLAGAAALPENIATSWTDTAWRPTSAEEVQPQYRLGSGRGVLDLTRVRLGDDRTLRTSVRAGAGELRIRVPDDLAVRLRVAIGTGSYWLSGADRPDASGGVRAGGGVNLDERFRLQPARGVRAQGTLDLRLEVSVGSIRLTRHPRPSDPPAGEAARAETQAPVRASQSVRREGSG